MSKRVTLCEAFDHDKPVKISKHSLDSDEEDYEDETDSSRLRERDIDGQENATVEYDEDIKITPFNMKEELEEDGYFDGAGNFVFKKSTDARDNWLEDVNWVEVNRKQKVNQPANTAVSDESPSTPLSKGAKVSLYEELLRLLRENETVLQAIKRMGAGTKAHKSASASQRWSKKKKMDVTNSEQGDPEGLVRATELADQLLQAGEFDVYQMSAEDIQILLRQTENRAEDDELDALGKHLDDQNSEKNGVGSNNGKFPQTDSNEDRNDDKTPVMWHLKRSDESSTEYEGPFSTEQLKDWVEEGKFRGVKCVLVRQVDKPDGQFYNINRIDFDLYE
ncbi:CD2 antigen cytoplasmic tail-binding protein 2 [Fasciola gigantica]|uniref:CD2 antigen cytoplasmic tail-binding protein 2 n=1 Tax=Fasciola gigantica TaxID=46835 RepID=A0A504Z6T8_FASGI|nr:CD2 antigen cytoplasmic tail-binding protein 2 [Fasciola gigantica]